jgi:hypothetical protein
MTANSKPSRHHAHGRDRRRAKEVLLPYRRAPGPEFEASWPLPRRRHDLREEILRRFTRSPRLPDRARDRDLLRRTTALLSGRGHSLPPSERRLSATARNSNCLYRLSPKKHPTQTGEGPAYRARRVSYTKAAAALLHADRQTAQNPLLKKAPLNANDEAVTCNAA